jgi:hypothetical protein
MSSAGFVASSNIRELLARDEPGRGRAERDGKQG